LQKKEGDLWDSLSAKFGGADGGKEGSSAPDPDQIYTVTRLNREAQDLLEGEFASIWVEGEVSNVSRSGRGHLYFTLKEEGAQLDAIMFRRRNRELDFELEDGQAVVAKGRLTIYSQRGRYQLKVRQLLQGGVGPLQRRFERLKEKLKEEGLFEEEKKKSLPPAPGAIGIVTSPKGAALRDIVTTIRERFPPSRLYLFPTRVQGEGASAEIVSALERAQRFAQREKLDLLIVGRGGGSLEDLWPFNEEEVARAIHRCPLPLISAVGHEVDYSISDFVADCRVPTPTAAGKKAVPEAAELSQRLKSIRRRLVRAQSGRMGSIEQRLESLRARFAFRLVPRQLEESGQRLDSLLERMGEAVASQLEDDRETCADLLNRLSRANPAKILGKGYSITRREGKILDSVEEVELGDRIESRLADGSLISVVQSVESLKEGERQ